MKRNFFSLDQNDFAGWWCEQGLKLGPHLRAQKFGLKNQSFDDFPINEVSPRGHQLLKESFSFERPTVIDVQHAVDGTIKALMSFSKGSKKRIAETVAIKFHKKYTLCLSSQVGCGMNCDFCFTATQGFNSHLLPEEIVGQYILMWEILKKNNEHPMPPNIVFMGQGEPLHNFNNVKKAISILTTVPGLSLGPKQITLSTIGHLEGLKRFEELPAINLAISLHSPFNEERSQIIPMNKSYSIDKIFSVLRSFTWGRRKLINFEYLLLGDFNDSEEHAIALSELISEFPCIVNIIPFNPYPGSKYKRPSEDQVESFKDFLVKKKVRTMVRTTKGDEILAACGQLANTLMPS